MELDLDQESHKFSVPHQVNADQAVLSLLAMAETFRIAKIPKYKMAIKCILAALKIPCSTELCAICNYELGKMLWLYTRNIKLAVFHLKKAYNMMKDLGQTIELARLKVVCLISEIYISERSYKEIKGLLRNEINDSAKYPVMHAKLLFLFSEIYLKLCEYDKAIEVANTGIIYFSKINETTIENYFRLAKSLILSIRVANQQNFDSNVNELNEILQNISSSANASNDMRAFCCSIQLCYFLSAGMLKNSKQCLRQLHMAVQSSNNQVAETNPTFRWLSSQMLTGLTYVFTVIANVQYNNLDRVNRYYSIASQHFENLKLLMRKSSWPIVERYEEEFIGQLELILNEATAQTHLIIGNPLESINNINLMVKIVRGSTLLFYDFESQIHTLLGFYSYYMRLSKNAEQQFKVALKSTTDLELRTVINLSLAILYMFELRDAEFYELFENVSPLKLRCTSTSLKSAAYFIQGLYYYLHMRTDDCRSNLMDCISISKHEDMARLQAMALLLLSKSFKCRDTDMLNAACEWTTRSNDVSLLIWANSQISYIKSENDQSQQMKAIDCNIERVEIARRSSNQTPHHRLIEWIDESIESICID